MNPLKGTLLALPYLLNKRSLFPHEAPSARYKTVWAASIFSFFYFSAQGSLTPDPFPLMPDPWNPDACVLNPFKSFTWFWSVYLFVMELFTTFCDWIWGGTTALGFDSKGWVAGWGGFDLACAQPILNIIFINFNKNDGRKQRFGTKLNKKIIKDY